MRLQRSTPTGQRIPTVLITGASTGLGLALTRVLLTRTDWRVVATARASSVPRLHAAGLPATDRLLVLPLDVTDEAQRRAAVDEVDRRWGGVDVLVNNAGIAYRSVVEHVNEAERIEQIHVNFRAPIALAALVLPGMRARRAGWILNVSSVGGMMAMPTMAIYSASKFALEGASEALWYEVRPWGVHVTLIEPGFIHSDAFERTRYTLQSRLSSDDHFDPYHAHYLNMAGFIARVMGLVRSTPDRVADRVLGTLLRRRPPLRALVTVDAHLFAWLRRLLPRGLYHEVLYRFLPRVHTWGPAWERLAASEPIPTEDDPTLEVPDAVVAAPAPPPAAPARAPDAVRAPTRSPAGHPAGG